MAEIITLKGKWFLPGNLEVQVPGTMTYNAEKGAYLNTEAPFIIGENSYWTDLDDAEIILGISTEGEPVTLYDCFRTSSSGGNTYEATWYANLCFRGCHEIDWSDFRFTEVVLRVHPLFMWLNSSGISLDIIPSYGLPIVFTFNHPDTIQFPIDNKVSGEFQFTQNVTYPDSFSETIKLNHSVVISIKSVENSDLHYDDLWKYVNRFINWLTIVTGYPCEIETAHFFHHVSLSQTMANGMKVPIKITRYAKERPIRKRPDRPQQFLFDYPKIRDILPGMISRWFGLYESLEVVIQILAHNMGRQDAFSEFHFKDIIQALEAFHRKWVRNERMPKAQYKKFKQKLLNQIADESDREFLKERLNYGNEPSLRERLYELIDQCEVSAVNAIIGDKIEFVKVTIDNRNYLTHLDTNGKKNILTPTELHHLSEKALALLLVTIMNEVIQDKEFVDKMMRRSKRWGFVIRQSNFIAQ